MPAKDAFHYCVRTALERDGWTITDDPLHVRFDGKDMYVDVIEDVVAEYAALPYSSSDSPSDIRPVVVCKHADGQFLLLTIGWNGNDLKKRVHNCVIHIEIIDGQIWVQCDRTEYGVAQELVDRGIPKERIELGFMHPILRRHSGFGTALENEYRE